jgi:nicotinate dehydrogenase subunit B
LEGVQQPATRDIGFMPGFQDALTDAQIVTLVTYMRQRYAPGRAAWEGVAWSVSRMRGR